MEKKGEKPHECICAALNELKQLQDYIAHSSIPYFGKLLSRLIEVDTIPFFLLTKHGFLEMTGSEYNKESEKVEFFSTTYFRIEEVDENSCCATLSLLRPFDICGDDPKSICEVMKLRKTTTCVVVDVTCIHAIQCLDIDLLKRKIIIEPKC